MTTVTFTLYQNGVGGPASITVKRLHEVESHEIESHDKLRLHSIEPDVKSRPRIMVPHTEGKRLTKESHLLPALFFPRMARMDGQLSFMCLLSA